MKKKELRERVEILSSLPKRKIKNNSVIDQFNDEKINTICEACYNIVHKKLPIEKKKEKLLKTRLLTIHKKVRQLANPNLKLKTKRRILKDSHVGKGVFSTIATIVVPTLLSLLAKK